MRSLILLFIAIPFFSGAQINRSAKKLAGETIREYVEHKLFKNKDYQPVSFGELKPVKSKRSDIAWTLVHKFAIKEGSDDMFGTSSDNQKPYKFLFFLDKKMKVLRAETFFIN